MTCQLMPLGAPSEFLKRIPEPVGDYNLAGDSLFRVSGRVESILRVSVCPGYLFVMLDESFWHISLELKERYFGGIRQIR